MTWTRGLTVGVITINFACSGARPPSSFMGPAPANAADREMAQLVDRALDRLWAAHPVEASAAGSPKYADRLPDWSTEAIRAELSRLGRLEQDVVRIEPGALSPSWAVDRELLLRRFAKERFVYDRYAPFDWNVALYADTLRAALYHSTRPTNDDDAWAIQIRDLVARVEQIPGFLEEAQNRLAGAPAVLSPLVADEQADLVQTIETILVPLVEPFPGLQDRFQIAQAEALQAIVDFEAFIDEELSERPQRSWQLGSDLYAEMLVHEVGIIDLSETELDVEAEHELHRLRLDLHDRALPLLRTDDEAKAALPSLSPEVRINRVVRIALSRVRKLRASDDLAAAVTSVRAEVDRLRQFIRKADFVSLPPPEDPLTVEAAPPWVDEFGVVFLQSKPALSTTQDHRLWVSQTYDPNLLTALAIHEVLPGHYLQRYWARMSPHDAQAKRVFENTATSEGWAVLADDLMREAGAFRDDVAADLHGLKLRLRVCVNALVDLRLHTDDVTPEPALDAWALNLMTAEGFYAPAEAERILLRAKLHPTELVAPFAGYVAMRAIWRDVRDKAGAALSRRAALDRILSLGGLPADMIRAALSKDGLL